MKYLVRKTTFSSEEPKKSLVYRYYSKFSPEAFKNDLMFASHGYKNNPFKFEICFVYCGFITCELRVASWYLRLRVTSLNMRVGSYELVI